MANEHEMRARSRKAYCLAAVLSAHGSDSRSAAALPLQGREIVAELAGTRKPSEATWALVVQLLAERERRAARIAQAWIESEDLADLFPRPAPVNVEALVG